MERRPLLKENAPNAAPEDGTMALEQRKRILPQKRVMPAAWQQASASPAVMGTIGPSEAFWGSRTPRLLFFPPSPLLSSFLPSFLWMHSQLDPTIQRFGPVHLFASPPRRAWRCFHCLLSPLACVCGTALQPCFSRRQHRSSKYLLRRTFSPRVEHVTVLPPRLPPSLRCVVSSPARR